MAPGIDTATRGWLRRLLVAAAIGLGVGFLVFLAVRGIGGAVLLVQQRELLAGVAGALGSLDSPPATDLRSIRLQLQALDALYWQRSIAAGIVVGAVGAIAAYLRAEHRAG